MMMLLKLTNSHCENNSNLMTMHLVIYLKSLMLWKDTKQVFNVSDLAPFLLLWRHFSSKLNVNDSSTSGIMRVDAFYSVLSRFCFLF